MKKFLTLTAALLLSAAHAGCCCANRSCGNGGACDTCHHGGGCDACDSGAAGGSYLEDPYHGAPQGPVIGPDDYVP